MLLLISLPSSLFSSFSVSLASCCVLMSESSPLSLNANSPACQLPLPSLHLTIPRTDFPTLQSVGNHPSTPVEPPVHPMGNNSVSSDSNPSSPDGSSAPPADVPSPVRPSLAVLAPALSPNQTDLFRKTILFGKITFLQQPFLLGCSGIGPFC